MQTDLRPSHLTHRCAVDHHPKHGTIAIWRHARRPYGFGGASGRAAAHDRAMARKALDTAPTPLAQHTFEIGVCAIDQQPPTPRHHPDQVMKLALDGCQIGIDVGVVEFEIVQNRRAWPVVHELGTLVEERRVVFVRLDDKER